MLSEVGHHVFALLDGGKGTILTIYMSPRKQGMLMQDKLKKKLLLLKSFEANLGISALEWRDVSKYNVILSDIEQYDYDLAEFKVDQSELKPEYAGGTPSRPRYTAPRISIIDMRKKLDAVLDYLDSEVPLSSLLNDGGITQAINICNRFGEVARQLRSHRKDHSPLLLKDEYDVQYLLHALLKLHFDDVRPEEYTPSHAGSSTRVDFMLPDSKLVIEVKYARVANDTKRLKEEILIDCPHYETHPSCERMLVLIFDADRVLKNPEGWAKDLERQSIKGNPIQVFVAS